MKFLIGLLTFVVAVLGIGLFLILPWQGLLLILVVLALWMLFVRRGQQAASVTGVGISTLGERAGSSAVIVVGIAGVVAVLVAMLSMAQGYQDTLRRTGSEDTALVLRGSSASEVSSVLSHDDVLVIEQAPGVAKDEQGKPIISPELVVAANLPVKGGAPDDLGSATLRGIGEQAWKLRSGSKIIAGHAFAPGKFELVVGAGAQKQFVGLVPGAEIKLGNQVWTVAGIFEGHDAYDSELWADTDVLRGAYRRGSSFTSVFARLTGKDAFDAFKNALTNDPRLQVDVDNTLNYFGKQSEGTTKIITGIGIVVGVIMAIGAIFGALNTMFAAVATRAREIATLRAIGFRSVPVVVAIMLETMLLALIGGVLGGFLAWLIFNGYTASTMAAGTTGQLAFEFKVAPSVLWTGIKWALAIGFIGGLYPALRAARLPVTTALREM
ncbi:ABC transporter permease [Pseudolysobacter antarcticus]|uniref:ABC transporter permease n=1 Tax=Pseudolysobacter antarcticus TaxID=2511995 RepID=A0A411HNA3_9GAMM|nr:ABC transporter permease [Pseudolysobacter antarcticus]QBB71958.1 ABC transporter permease [Pseudolysobacter antarcticus]